MLSIEIEYLTGIAFAANARGDGPDWPPQPDRLFSALVASWAARGQRAEERRALEWLEAAEAPRIQCSGVEERPLVDVYVPPNDFETGSPDDRSDPSWLAALKAGKALNGPQKKDRQRHLGVVPAFRVNRQPRRFPAAVPHSPLVRFLWAEEPDAPVLEALDALARDTSYLGHSASLVRCRAATVDDSGDGTRAPRRRLYSGRLAELEERFRAGERPLLEEGSGPPAEPAAPAPDRPGSLFGTDWIVLAGCGGSEPDPVAVAVAAKVLIKAVQKGYGEGRAPAWVSGHDIDGTPLAAPHLAAVPLLDAGWRWSQGRLMGMALVLPRELELGSRRARDPMACSVGPADAAAQAEEDELFRALGRVRIDGAEGLELKLLLPGGLEWRLRRVAAPDKASLRPERYARPSRLWGSVTPIALDRHPKAEGDVAEIIKDACERIGLPRPVEVVPAKHSAFTGTHPARPKAGAPEWTRWRLPGALKGRRLTHATIRFADSVAGPVMLGAGRFAGLGLCLGLDDGGNP